MPDVARYDQLLPLMVRDLPAFDKVLTLQALKAAGREFCNQSEAWVETLDPIDIVADQRAYTLDYDFDAAIKLIKSVYQRTETEVTDDLDGSEVRSVIYDFIRPATFQFKERWTPSESVTDSLVVEVVLVPKLSTVEISAQVLNDWAEGIIGYAMFLLLKSANPNLAAVYLQQFNDKVTEALVLLQPDITP